VGAGSSLAEVFQRGLADHQAGRLQEAETAYRQVLAVQPAHAGALHLLGLIAHHAGRFDAAETLIRKAIAEDGGQASYRSNLGVVLGELGRLAQAEESLRAALRLEADYADAHYNLGVVLDQANRPAEAEASYRQALRLRPNHPGALNNLGHVLEKLDRPGEAEPHLRAALRLRPDYPDAHNNLGIILAALGRASDAEASFREALRLRPDFADAWGNLSAMLEGAGRASEAEASCREALRLKPDSSGVLNNLGIALAALGRPAEAQESYRACLALAPDFANAHVNLSYALLLDGQFTEGWREHEWRWRGKHLSAGVRGFSAPLWAGEPIGDRVLLLHAEQGLGDTLQFCRYVPALAASALVVLEAQAPLTRLLSSLPGDARIIARGEPLPAFDLQCPLMSLPWALGTTLDTVPATIPYLTADPVSASRWHQRLASLPGLRVGLAWAGGQRLKWPELAAVDARRSIALETLTPLAGTPGVSFVSLQKGDPASQALSAPPELKLHDFTDELEDFANTAALVDGLDLVISVDTSVVHLAGAMGKPVWLLNRYDTCWRWMLNRDDSPWYPTLRQFRQPSPGDWESVIRRVRDSLLALAAGDRDPMRPGT